ncbi:unnamed protein product [Fusarium equiseti]|uniref:Heterokaryon incompatibility domain-containing protein n=1 Tax=Fusarium equiseti TaxID=61235 RepID=A0A8J2IIA1_FUSEQ|nr:unnamed protein product [Fusarium equiseti]
MPPTTRQTSRRLYQPLDRNGRGIRLIELLPNYPHQTIQCKLHTVTLTSDTYYVCISYVWGDPYITEEIIVNGISRQVTVNLVTALRHLKKHWFEIERESDPDVDTSKFRLWADALSINQDDPLERGHQVSLMADIYSSAEMVLAWLSSDDRDVALGFSALNHVYLDRVHLNELPHTDWWWRNYEIWYTTSWLLPDNSGIRENNEAPLRPDEPLLHLRQFWKLNFWSRVWIQQEIVLPRRVYYVSPSHRMSHEQCYEASRWVNVCLRSDRRELLLTQQQHERTKKLAYESRAVMKLSGARYSLAKSSKEWVISACVALHFSPGLQATDALDYVYGLLAITKVPIEPDYTKSIREVYIEFVQWLISVLSTDTESEGSVYRCYRWLNRHAVGIRQLYGLPTWAPVFPAGDLRHDVNPSKVYWPPLYEPLPPVVTSVGSLWTKAVKAQTVDTVYHEPGSPDFLFKGLSSFIHDFPQMYGKATYINGRPILEELCRTLLLKDDIHWYNVKRLFIALMESGQCRREDFDPDLLTSVDSSELEEILQEWKLAAEHLLGCTFFTTEDGYIGLIGEEVLPGDVVYYVAHNNSLQVLRPEDGHYLFVSNCVLTDFDFPNVSDCFTPGQSNVEKIEIR